MPTTGSLVVIRGNDRYGANELAKLNDRNGPLRVDGSPSAMEPAENRLAFDRDLSTRHEEGFFDATPS